ncbi:MAG: DnaB-like helicase N-terminal domain-containing protein [Gemmatimonadaceae bacterium]|jgi:replicative DNA helicase
MKLPSNPRAERAVLGALMMSTANGAPETVDRVRSILSPPDFYATVHRLIYQEILALHAEGIAPDLVQLHDRFLQHGTLKDIGGLDALNKLIDNTVTTARAEQNARIVLKHALSRQAIDTAQKTIEGISAGELDPVEAATALSKAGRDIIGRSGGSSPESEYERWKAGFDRKLAGGATFRSTTYSGLDKVLSIGFGPGISVWAGRTGSGKSTTFGNLARRLALAGQRVLAFPNETGCREFADMMVCAGVGMPHDHLLKYPERVKPEQYDRSLELGKTLYNNVVLRPPPTPKEGRRWGNPNAPIIEAYAAEIVAADCPIVMVELFQMGFASLDPSDIVLALYELRRFIGTANRYHMAIFHHVSQKDEKGKQNKKRPKMHDIRASQGYAESADLVIGIHRPTEPEREKDTIEYEVLKQRDGSPAGPIVQFAFNGPLRLIDGEGDRIDGLMVSREPMAETTGAGGV